MLVPKPVILAIKHSRNHHDSSHSTDVTESKFLEENLVEKETVKNHFDPNQMKEENHDISEVFIH